MPPTLRACIDDALARARARARARTTTGTTAATLSRGVEHLIETYRSGETPTTPILATEEQVLAYAAYRMPATYAVIHAALRHVHTAVPALQPRTLVDVGAGTGAAAWAATDVWPTIDDVTLLEQSAAAIDLGSRLMASSERGALQGAAWRVWRLSTIDADAVTADVATAAYVLGELTEHQRAMLLALLMKSAPTVVVVEPGTPAGFARIISARDALINDGFTIAAPCPHQLSCPMLERSDWCHFSERLERSHLHRVAKAGALSYEDEKYSYVVGTRAPVNRPAARIVRHPQLRKGLVSLQLCEASGDTRELRIAKSQGVLYKEARNARWGDGWPPR
jgi:ribosomal protein RSM22 (predicted rRNA methylase)